MKRLRTLDPLTALKGQLNFLRTQYNTTYLAMILTNMLRPKTQSKQTNQSSAASSSLQNISLQDIKSLAISKPIDPYQHKKMLFQSHVHRHSNQNIPVGTIYQQLDKHQKRLVLSMLNFSDKLSSRHMAYLNYAIRLKMGAQYPNWKTLHWNADSPLRREFGVIPTLQSLKHLEDIKVFEKKKVTTKIISTRKVQQLPVNQKNQGSDKKQGANKKQGAAPQKQKGGKQKGKKG